MTSRMTTLLLALGLVGCGGASTQTNTATTAGPQHPSVEIALERAPDPASYLPEDEAVYLAWLRPEGVGTYLRAGPLDYDPRADAARLVIDAPSDQFAVVVTAEPTPQAEAPNGYVVMHVECGVTTHAMPATPAMADLAAPGEPLASELTCEPVRAE